MKKYQLLKKVLIAFTMPLLLVACDDDDESGSAGVDFGNITSSVYEDNGTQTVTIPFRSAGNIDNLQVDFGGTATEGEDFELLGITAEGVQISILDDAAWEKDESVRVQLNSSDGSITGNNFHTITILSCGDIGGLDMSYFAGEYEGTEKYGPEPGDWYGPYTIHVEQDEVDPNKFHLDNFYDSGMDAYMIINLAEGTVYFPDQTPMPDGTPSLITASTGTLTIDECNGSILNINLNYDGGDWTYTLHKHFIPGLPVD
jgi:hypothetical protein